jgi:hypothetical protein
MATVTLTVNSAARSGLDLTANKTTVNTSNTYRFLNDARTKLYVNNIANANCAVSIVTPATSDGLAISDRTVTVTTLHADVIGAFPATPYNDDSGYVSMTFDQIVEITAFNG